MSNWKEKSWYLEVNAHRVAMGLAPLDLRQLEGIVTRSRRAEDPLLSNLLAPGPRGTPVAVVGSRTGYLSGMVARCFGADDLGGA